MSKRCARCEKTVYPLEELKCLDKIWHKGCFKCQECAMTLSMKTYKGFNKLPYCEAHIPKAKATTVAETPESRRLAENTKIQSNVKYHADFEKNKAKFTQVDDDPETLRLKKNSKIISNVSYHGELEKKAIMEKKRSEPGEEDENNPVKDNPATYQENHQMPPPQKIPAQPQHHQPPPSQHHHHQHQQQQQPMPTHHQPQPQPQHSPVQHHQPQPNQTQMHHSAYNNGHPHQQYHQHQAPQNTQAYHNNSAYQQYPNANNPAYQHQHANSNRPAQQHPQNTRYGHPNSGGYPHQHPHHHQSQNSTYHHHPQDPNHNNSPYSSRNSQTLIYSSQTGPVQHEPTRSVGSIADYDPVNDQYGSIAQNPSNNRGGGHQNHQPNTRYIQPHHQQQHPAPAQSQINNQTNQQPPRKVNAPPTQIGRCYRAVYDYEAADTDEVSFRDGDIIINCTKIDEGWMTGTIQRNGHSGMLPANYVERVS